MLFSFQRLLYEEANKLRALLPPVTVQTLSLSDQNFDLTITDQFTSVVHLTLADWYYTDLYDLCKYLPNLHYLSIGTLYHDYWHRSIDETRQNIVHLTRLVINNCKVTLNEIPYKSNTYEVTRHMIIHQ
jgi:hypothetical protein